MTWLPIDTAPRDGSQIILADRRGVDVGSWQDAAPAATESGVEVECGMPEGLWGILAFFPDDRIPTHWMPLPEPPQ